MLRSNKLKSISTIIIFGLLLTSYAINAEEIKISSLSELAKYAAESANVVTMEAGIYQMEDYLTPEVISNTLPVEIGKTYPMIMFSGSDNTFDFTGVTIEINTKLLSVFKGRVSEFYFQGNNIFIKGLTVTDIGNHPTHKGGHSFTVGGDNIKVDGVTLNVKGSSPYGYGDLLGKGKGALVPLKKHSAMCVLGLNDTIINCSIFSKAFGHCFFVQGGRNIYFENCYAEGVTRTTDEMLAEKSGPAYDVGFTSVYKNYDGEKMIPPGYTKSMNECGFRMYGKGGGNATGAVTAVNCKAKNTRIGFAFAKITDEVLIKDCEAIGCENGYNIGGVTIENSRGDVVNGPLLYVNKGHVSTIELYLLPTESKSTVHALACIAGYDHKVTIKKWRNMSRDQVHPIKIGATRPNSTNGYSPLGSTSTSGVIINNFTGMPVELNSETSFCEINSSGGVTDNGNNNWVKE